MNSLLRSLVVTLLFVLPQFVFSQSPPPPPSGGGTGCDNSPLLCNINDLNGYNGATTASGSSTVCPFGSPGSSCPQSTCENNIWFSFTANLPTMQISIDPYGCTPAGNTQMGLQGAIYEVTDCTNLNGFTEVAPCFSQGVATNDPAPFTLTANNLTVGEIYIIMLDGFGGALCEFDVDVLTPGTPTLPPVLPPSITGPATVCPGAVVEYCVPVGTGITDYTWSWNTGDIGTITNLGLSADGTEICATVEVTSQGFGLLQVVGTNPCYPTNIGTNAQLTPINSLPIITPPESAQICLGDIYPWECYPFITNPGFYECTYSSWLGCDSTVSIVITPFPVTPPNIDFVEVCGETLPYVWNSQDYSDSGTFFYEYQDSYGCTVEDQLLLTVYEAESVIQPPAIIGCGLTDSEITLDASNSTSVPANAGATLTYLWTGPGIVGVDNQMTVNVNLPGEYFFEVTQVNFDGDLTCTSTSSVIVEANTDFPDAPGLNGQVEICGVGQVATYTAIAASTGVPPTDYTWQVTGGTIQSAIFDVADVEWNGPGLICVAAFNDCDTSAYTCLNVNVGDVPTIPGIVGPLVACETDDAVVYSIISNDWIDTWTVSGGATFSPDPINNQITVDFTGSSNVEICVTAENDCGPSVQLCESIALTVIPIEPTISGDPIVCAGDTATYSIPSDANVTTITTTIPGANGTIISGDGTTDLEVVWNTAGTDQVCFQVENSCGVANQVCFDVDVTELPTATFTDQTFNFCPGENEEQEVTIDLTGVGPWELQLTETTTGSLLDFSIIASNSTITLPSEGVYIITNVSDANLCIGTGTGQITIEPFVEPTATLSGSGGICENSGDCVSLQVDLTGTANWSIEYSVGGVVFTVNGINASPYALEICQPGTVELVSVQDANCSGTVSGSVIVDDLGSPSASNIDPECDTSTGLTYVVSFDIVGGNGTYTVEPAASGSLTGSTFTSNPIPSGAVYMFEIFDTNNCDTFTVSGVNVCNCANDVGTMDQTPLELCDPICADAAAGYSNTEVLGVGDLLQFVLHEGSGLSIVSEIAINNTGEFCFDAALGMNYGQTYYISAITGDDDGTGNIDLNDLCLSVSQGTPVVFFEVPEATIGSNGSICIGETYSINVDFTAGVGPYALEYIDGETGILDTLNTNENPFTLEVSPSVTTNYTFTMVSTSNCSNPLTTVVEVEVFEAPTHTAPVTNCNSTADAFTVTFDIVDGNPTTNQVLPIGSGTITGNTFTSNPIPNGNTYFFELTNGQCDTLEISTNNPVNCPCLSEVGEFESTTLLTTCGDGPITLQYNPALGAGENLDGNDVLGFLLYEGSATSIATVLAYNSTESFSFAPGMTYGQSYFVAAAVGNDDGSGNPDLTDVCLSMTDGVEIIFYEIPTVSMLGDTAICNGEATNLTFEFTGDAPFEVTLNDGNSDIVLTGIVSSPFFYEVNPTASTSYTIVSATDENCTATASGTAMVNVNNAPTTGPVTETINNDNTFVTVSFDIIDGTSPYIITLSNGDTIQEPSNQFVFDSIPCGNGYYFEVDDNNGCGPEIINVPTTDCPCLTNAGTISEMNIIEVCNDTVSFTYDASMEFLDGNDTLQFIIHNGDESPILPASSSPDFVFQSPLEYGVSYIVSAIAGDMNQNSAVDINDPCFDIDGLGQVIFYEGPNAILSGGGDICLFDSTAIYVEFTAGIGPWEVTLVDPVAEDTTIHTLNSALDSIIVGPSVTTTFSLLSVTDAVGLCSGTVGGTVDIQVNSIPYASGVNIATDYEDETVTVSFNIIGGDPTTYTVTDPDGNPMGVIDGVNFVSFPIACDTIPGGIQQVYYVQDTYQCITDVVDTLVECVCLTSITDFNFETLAYCYDEAIEFDSIVNYNLDGNDVVSYLLLDDPNNYSSPLMISSTPEFDYDETILDCGVSYFVVGVAGDSDASGLVDLTDQCLSISNSFSFVVNCALEFDFVEESYSICEGDLISVNTTANGDGPFLIQYLDPDGTLDSLSGILNGELLTFEPSTSGTYTLVSVTEEDSDLNCSNLINDSFDVEIFDPSNSGTVASTPQLCEGSTDIIALENLLSGEDLGGDWSALGSGQGFNSTNGTLNIAGLSSGTYQFRYTVAGQASCDDVYTDVSVIVNPLPSADAGQPSTLTCSDFSADLGGDNTSSGSIYAYQWRLNNDIIAGETAATITVDQPGTYTLEVTNTITGCTVVDDVLVEDIVETLQPSFELSDLSCFGSADGEIIFTDVQGGQAPYMYSINNSDFETEEVFTNQGAQTFTLVVMDINGCTSNPVTVNLEEPDELSVQLVGQFESEDNSIEFGDSIVIEAVINNPFDQITWSPSGVVDCDTCESVMISPEYTTILSVEVGIAECRDSDQLTVFVRKDLPVFVPTAFSPNNDNVNDVLSVFVGDFVREVKQFRLFDRWGEEVFTRLNYLPSNGAGLSEGWDGTLGGKPMPSGVYVYLVEVEFEDGNVELFNGETSLIR